MSRTEITKPTSRSVGRDPARLAVVIGHLGILITAAIALVPQVSDGLSEGWDTPAMIGVSLVLVIGLLGLIGGWVAISADTEVVQRTSIITASVVGILAALSIAGFGLRLLLWVVVLIVGILISRRRGNGD